MRILYIYFLIVVLTCFYDMIIFFLLQKMLQITNTVVLSNRLGN